MPAFPRAIFLLLPLAVCPVGQAAPTVDYNRDIKPILSENCFSCHGPDEKARKAKLRLDVAESAYAAAGSGLTPLKPADLANSEVWQRLVSTDPEEVMPPPDSNHTLTAAQKAQIKTWIEAGAAYASHWSFVAPRKSPLPAAGQAIDSFVLARLAAEKLAPSTEADRRTLIRRLSFDLTGLPPSGADVEAFANDRSPDAYDRLVARLLTSPHFGERLALDWLDAARYADTNGFSIDGGRHMWLWRDWVIQAFNDNKPYNQFLVEQLAGDLLPDSHLPSPTSHLPSAREAALIATGFQRNNMVTHEGGTIPEENLVNYNADRVKTLGESVLGLTLACAQCHDHKFDPISMRDYYGLFAFFNSLGDRGLDGNGGNNPGPSIRARTVLRTGAEESLRRDIAALEAKLARRDDTVLAAWEGRERAQLATRGRDLKVIPLKAAKVSTPNRGAGFDVTPDGRVRLRDAGDLGAFDILTELPSSETPITGLRFVMHPIPDNALGSWGGGPTRPADPAAKKKKAAPLPEQKGTFRLTAISASAEPVPGDQINLHKLEKFTRVTASSWEPANPAAGCLDPRNDTGWSPDLATEGPVHLTATLARPLNARATPHLTVQLNFGAGRGLIAGLIEVCAITGTDDGTDLPAEIVAALATPAAQRSPEILASLWRECSARAVELSRDRVALANLRERLAALTEPFTTMVMAVADKPRETFVLNRGDYQQPREKVTAATPAALPALPGGAADRLGLARWIVSRENPLTARVAVNRIWKLLFGTGLVATPQDFGSQGEWPSHPELLDWLAVDFMEHGWNVKRLITQIVTSTTYRQSSAASAALIERDPQNRLLARGPRFRLSAELVRDNALAVSGLLVPAIGGPSVNPYTPGDLWREVSHYGSTPATSQTFVQDHGEKLYRRSLYTYWKRTAPPPNMTAFDAPNREVCTISRGNTTTPLQALVTLNDPQFVEAARVFAERILAQRGNDSARLRWAFAECLSRPPQPKEFDILAATLTRERARYAKSEAAARTHLAIGESPRNPALAPAEHAAWSQVATLLLNLSEAVTRN
ncbi:MAG: PSD1 domain-containing protein [Verrucomicrobia bacterium]|nr:PSD1 domain-containing protein [Verrucomicrobiota bacterium]